MSTTDAATAATARADDHLVLAFDGTTAPPAVLDRLRQGHAPGVTLFRFANVASAAQVAELTTELEAANGGDLPLLVAADQETGQLLGLGDDTTPFPGAMALGATGDAALAERVATAVGHELRALGVTMNYAPVTDVATNPANPSLGARAFGDDPAAVGRMAAATVRGLGAAGVAATTKHFPGKGEAVVDPHHELPLLDLDRARLDAVELAPFRATIAAGVPATMVGHYALPAVTGRTDVPTSVAREVVTGLLREELGFDGVVITDALDMGALRRDDGRGADLAAVLAAGVDLLLCGPDATANARLRTDLDEALAAGRVPAATTAAARARVARLRRWVASFPRPPLEVVGNERHRDLAREVARRATTLVRDDDDLLPLSPGARVVAIMVAPSDLTPADTSSTLPAGLAPALARHVAGVDDVVVDSEPGTGDLDRAVAAATAADIAVVATARAGPAQAALVRAVVATGTPTVTVAVRTPFDLVATPEVGTHLCTYGIQPPSLDALAEALVGRVPLVGRLPAAIPGLAPRGHGLHRA